MTIEEFYTVIRGSGFPVAYEEFDSEPKPPFLVYEEFGRENVYADDKIYTQFHNIAVHLYTKERDYGAENDFEIILENAGLIYTYEPVGKIKSENMYEVIYRVRI